MTLAQFRQQLQSGDTLLMIRGLRGDGQQDAQHELDVMLENHRDFGVGAFTYFFSDPQWQQTSSSRARALAQELQLYELGQHVAPLVVTALVEKSLHIRNLFLVAGRPASGKSTFLRMLAEADRRNVVIATDDFNHQLRPIVEAKFPGEDLVQLAIHREAELNAVLHDPWFACLRQALLKVPKDTNVYLESALGLQLSKQLFRYLGGKVLYVDCGSAKKNVERNHRRNTDAYEAFIRAIPDLTEAQRIAHEFHLTLTPIDTSGTKKQLRNFARTLQVTPQGEVVSSKIQTYQIKGNDDDEDIGCYILMDYRD